VKVLTWFWKQTPARGDYDADKVNRWAEGITRHLRLPHTLACVTDQPEGIDPAIEIIPLPRDFYGVRNAQWSEASGLPQCYRRLALFSPKAAEIFGATDIVSTDLDALFFRPMDHLFSEPPDFRMFRGTSSTRPYNGSMLRIRAGARPQVYQQFAADPLGVAKKARALYIGSDQAVISMILGKGEKTWGEAEGVFHYSPKFARLYSANGRQAPPANMAVLFFPGHIKPWSVEARRLPWIADAWKGKPTPPRHKVVRLRAYRDPKGWGKEIEQAARAKGLFVSPFTRARGVNTGVAFVRLDQQGAQREVSRRLVHDLNAQGIRTLPTLRESLWYDDKGAQLPVLQPWMPRTVYFRDQRAAEAWLPSARFPMVSKSTDGAGSKGVRLLHTIEEAQAELRQAFRAPGIRSVYDRWQLGYVYWQDLVPDQPCDYRVCIVGGELYGLIRDVRPGDFRASGSGVFRPMTLETERERAAATLAAEIASTIRTDWMAFDIVFARTGRPLVLEMSSAWTMKAYADAPCFHRGTLKPSGRTGAASFTIAVEIMEAMACA
jgi:glutathione synthase/RimK-type ligase-like ATP-grasp enzyme